jgi:protein-tyrosine-phosphatase
LKGNNSKSKNPLLLIPFLITMKKILFVCIENSNRSQMAEAFAHIHADDLIQAYSAGSKPSGKINSKAIASMNEVGYDLSTHDSKSLDEIPNIEYDAVVTMGCGDACPWIPARLREDWDIPDPRDMGENEFNSVRDLISEKVLALVEELKAE